MGELLVYNNEMVSTEELNTKLLNAQSEKEINDIISVFNLNIKKKDVIRANRFSELQDRITNQISERVEKHPGNFSNKDLLDYMNALQNIINKQSEVEKVDIPQIAVQNNVNVNILDTLNKDSREKVRDVVQILLDRRNQLAPPLVEKMEGIIEQNDN